MRITRAIVLLAFASAAMATGPRAAGADKPTTAREFLAMCDRLDPQCRDEFVAGLQAVNEAKLACPPRIDVNAPITPWLDEIRRRLTERPSLADADRLQLEAFVRLWPCPNN